MQLTLPLALLPLVLAVPQDTTPAERGLAAIRPEHIEADLYFLADDLMRGRDTPSHEQRVAARYLRSRLMRLGFQPAGEDGTYFDRYEMLARRLDVAASSLVLTTEAGDRRLIFGEEYFLGSTNEAASLEASGGVVFCGTGTHAEFDEVGREALEGRWALCFDTGSGTLRRRNLASNMGAVGILVVPGPEYDKDPYPVRHRRASDTLVRGRLLGPAGDAPEEAREVYPQVFLHPDTVEGMLAEAKLGQELGFEVREVRVAPGRVALENVCGLWPGDDPELGKEVIVVSAHYDHVGTRDDRIYNGADDNGSGSTGLLAIAEALVAHGPLKRSVLLIWVSGEEKGLWGSAAWAAEPTLAEGQRAVCNLNIDMIGRNAADELYLTPSEDHPMASFLTAIAREVAPLEGFPELGSADAYYNRSDQASFARLDIPVCFLFAGEHEDYHQPTDTPDKIDYDKVSRVSRTIFRMILRLQDEPM